MSVLFSASEIDGNEVVPFGDSLSSLVDLLEFDSGGEMYPDVPCAELLTDAADEYGGGGPEYIVDGELLIGALEMVLRFGSENRLLSAFSSR